MSVKIGTIVERAASPGEAAGWDSQPIVGIRNDESEFLLGRWEARVRRLHPDPKLFDKRLEKLGLDRATALDWLRPRHYPPDRSMPTWAVLLGNVLSPKCFIDESMDRKILLGPMRRLDGPDEQLPRKRPVFLELARPFLRIARRELKSSTAINRWMSQEAIDDVCRVILHRISSLGARTLAYELKQRSRDGSLLGETSQERYIDFMSRHIGTLDGLGQLFLQYPVLARMLAVRTEQSIDQVVEIVERLEADAKSLNGWFKSNRIAQIQLGLSDPHLGGRSVAIIKFEGGAKLVYKPRSLAIDEAYSTLLAWWNTLTDVPHLKAANVLSRQDYGWSEYIESAECQTDEEIAEYYRRQGAQTAIFYFLRGTDFHSENFVAHAAWPVPIDLECLLSAVHAQGSIELDETPPCFRLTNFVFSTCMTPNWKSGEAGQICSIDGGISGNSGRSQFKMIPTWSGLETDALRMSMERREETEVPPCLPRQAGVAIGPDRFVEPVIQGFKQAYDAMVAHREKLLALGGLIDSFKDLSTRCLMRSTVEYTFLLSWSTAPDHLTSGAAHDLAFELLVKYGAGIGSTLDWIDDEKRALWHRDVPIYFAMASSKRLTSPAGEEVGPELNTTSYEQVKASLMAASPDDRDWQSELLRATLQMSIEPIAQLGNGSTNDRYQSEVSAIATTTNGTYASTASDDVLLAEATRLGELLARQAIHDSRGATWLTLEWETHDPNAVAIGPVRSGLYSGGAGIALFLANLSVTFGESEFADLALEALRFAESQDNFMHRRWSGHCNRLAAFSSPYSQAYALAECGRIFSKDSLIERAFRSVINQNETPTVDNPDFINGAAGAICVLLHLHSQRADDRLLRRASYLAESIQQNWRSADGKVWNIPGTKRPILGLAHGQVGIAMAFSRLANWVDASWAAEAVRQALQFESELFDPSRGDWPNCWYESWEGTPMVGWCGGAAGHGLARLSLLGNSNNEPLHHQGIWQAIDIMNRRTALLPQNLCCGEPGCIWLLAEAGRQFKDQTLLDSARAAATELIQYRRDHGFWHLRPVTEREILPTLMGGIAGIGMSLLEARCPGSISQVVTLA